MSATENVEPPTAFKSLIENELDADDGDGDILILLQLAMTR